MKGMVINMKNIRVEMNNIDKEVLDYLNRNTITANILFRRGIDTIDKVKEFMEHEKYIPTNWREFPCIEKGVEIIEEAIRNKEKIYIYGDYDADGVTATTTLMEALGRYTDNIYYHVPDRFSEGYGMNIKVIERMIQEGTKLIITCDCGISNVEEIKRAKEFGIKVIVTDHHTPPEELPPADVLLNPKFLEKTHRAYNISGCAMAWFMASAFMEKMGDGNEADRLLDMSGISVIADVVPLVGENRYIYNRGKERLLLGERPGLRAMMETGKFSFEGEEDIGFQIAPRINASGRLESARKAVDLMLEKDVEKARDMSEEIEDMNKRRKKIQEDIVFEAVREVEEGQTRNVNVLYGSAWHHGVMGIAAGKICEMYNKPAILLSLKEDDVTVTGSARSTENVNIYELLKVSSKYLDRFGGHSQAAGLSLKKDNIAMFMKDIEKNSTEFTGEYEETITADAEIKIEDVTEEFVLGLRKLAPFGNGFEKPKFLIRDVKVKEDKIIREKHHIMTIDTGKILIKATKWGITAGDNITGEIIDILCSVSFTKEKGIQLDIEQYEISNAKKISKKIVLDCRGQQYALSDESETVFYEGIEKKEKTFSRENIEECKVVSLFSIPADVANFKKVISGTNAEIIKIYFSEDILTLEDIIKRAIGILKGSEEKGCGKETLASSCGISTRLLELILDYLYVEGIIKFNVQNNQIAAEIGDGDKKTNRIKIKNAMKDKYMEEYGFKIYMRNAGIFEIKKMAESI